MCRSQKDINSNVDLTTAIKEEERFFVTHPAYRSIAHRCGTRYLAVLLNQVLVVARRFLGSVLSALLRCFCKGSHASYPANAPRIEAADTESNTRI